jgi:hypothetical protein
MVEESRGKFTLRPDLIELAAGRETAG